MVLVPLVGIAEVLMWPMVIVIWESSSEAEVEAILLGGGSGEFESEPTLLSSGS